MGTGLVAGVSNGMGNQFVEKGFNSNWDWEQVGKSTLFGLGLGGIMGVANGVITEHIYQRQLKKGYLPTNSSDMAEALGESAGSVASNLEASGGNIIWPFGHNYANQYVSLQPSICIGLETGRCTINIDPYAPMVPNQSTFYVPKL